MARETEPMVDAPVNRELANSEVGGRSVVRTTDR